MSLDMLTMHTTIDLRAAAAIELPWIYNELCVLVVDAVHRLHGLTRPLAMMTSLLPLLTIFTVLLLKQYYYKTQINTVPFTYM